jgi:hypothetical protein
MSEPTALELLKAARAAMSEAGWDRPDDDLEALPPEWAPVVGDLYDHLQEISPEPDAKKVRHAVGDLAVEFAKPNPAPAEVREALDRGLRYAGLSEATQLPEVVRPAVERVRAWLATAKA